MAHYGAGEPWRQRIDEQIRAWRERCIIQDRSLVKPDSAAWTPANVDEVIARVLDDPIQGEGSFGEKLTRQLENCSTDVRLVAYEALAVHFLFPRNVSGPSKRDVLSRVGADLGSASRQDLERLHAALDHGIGSGGTRFNIRRDLQVGLLLRFVQSLKRLSEADRRTTIDDPEATRAIVDQLEQRGEPMRHVLLHLLHPDEFERIASGTDKEQIAQALGESGDPEDVDRRLQAIRRRLADELGDPGFDFYEPPVVTRWRASSGTPAVLAVYIGDRSKANFDLALAGENRWGFREASAATRAVAAGDLVVFAQDVPGGPRVPIDAWLGQRFARVVVARATGPVVHDTSRVWPTETPGGPTEWPEVIELEFLGEHRDVPVKDASISRELALALRNAGCTSRPVRLATDTSSILAVGQAPPSQNAAAPTTIRAAADGFTDAVSHSNLRFGDPFFARAFLAALVAKRFVLLAGLSGSGKTQIARRLGQWFSSAAQVRYAVVPVRPDWSTPDAVLGYEDALAEPTSDGRRPWAVTSVLKLMLQARTHPDQPFLLVLDEMNLAHVERYFADFLSGIESGENVVPHVRLEEDGRWRLEPGNDPLLPIPDNLFVVGTVNIDETTFGFSPKVLDRAFVFEFDVRTEELTADLRPLQNAPVGAPGDLAAIVDRSRDAGWHTTHPHPSADLIFGLIRDMHRPLSSLGLGFGHRTVQEIMRFAAAAEAVGIDDLGYVLDRIALTKILPRVHGPWRLLRPVVDDLRKLCEGGDDRPAMPLTSARLERLARQGEVSQYVTFLS